VDSLSQQERGCLHGIAMGQVRCAADCAPGVLLHLAQRGLVEQRPLRSLPLGNTASDYILTPAGRLALERCE